MNAMHGGAGANRRSAVRALKKRFLFATAGLFLVAGLAAGTYAVAQGVNSARAMGASCGDATEGELCSSHICIDVTFGYICTERCETDADCPENYGCKRVPEDGAGTYASLCFPRRVTITEQSE